LILFGSISFQLIRFGLMLFEMAVPPLYQIGCSETDAVLAAQCWFDSVWFHLIRFGFI